jgi:hypothetical protein
MSIQKEKAIELAIFVDSAMQDNRPSRVHHPEGILVEMGSVFATAVKSQHRNEADFRCGSEKSVIKGDLVAIGHGNLDGPDANGINA